MPGLLLLLALSAPEALAPSPNLLRTAALSRVTGAPAAARMTDGVAPVDGEGWDTPHTATLAAGGVVEWDLGAVRHVGQLRLQADNNDTYLVSTSVDGASFALLWAARPVGVPGMQTRTSEPVDAQARFVRLTAEGGDHLYSVGELEVFDGPQELRAAVLRRITPPPPAEPPPFNTAYLLVLGVAAWGAWLLRQAMLTNRRRASEAAGSREGPQR
jgi:hypothetical protein